MADLENLLLQAAGRTGGSSGRKNQSRPQSKWRREGSYSDGSESKDDDSDDSSKFSKRKSSRPPVPVKKRFDQPEKDKRSGWEGGADDDKLSGDDSDSAPSVGSDLYKGDSDKEELEKMPELAREMILAERSTKIDDYKLRQKARASSSSKAEKVRKESPPSLPSRSRTSSRFESKASAKNDALNELRAKRMKQQDPEGYRRMKDSSSIMGPRDSSPAKRRAIPMDESSSDSGESEDGNKSDTDGIPLANAIGDSLDDDSLRFEDIKDITIRRSKLAKWFVEPFFEELIAGCFVRVALGMSRSGVPTYRLCIVKNVDATDKGIQYKLEGRNTNKYLNVIWGAEDSAARWQMDRVSNAEPDIEEFKRWFEEVTCKEGRMPSRQDILDKKEAIKNIKNYVYTSDTVKKMVQDNESASSRPLNAAAEKDRLRKQMEAAELRGDDAEMDKIRERLKELGKYRRAKNLDAKALRLTEMNKRNKAENFKNASELKPVNTSLKAGEAGYDPFSRRWTRSTNYYVSKPGGEANGEATENNAGVAPVGSGEANGVGTVNGAEVGVAATAAALEAAEGAGKLIDTNAPVDLGTESNSLHNFELHISLAGLQKFGGPSGAVAGFLAKKQKTEATIGYRVPENDGRRHAVTLTISDYKRRMGLI